MTPTTAATALRTAIPDDVGTIAAIHLAAWRATHRRWVDPAQPERIGLVDRLALWSGVVAGERWPVTVAERDGALLGFIHVLPCRDDDRDGRVTVEVSELYVAPEHQRRGLGAALLARALAELPAQGFRSVSLWVGAHNHVARRFYEAHGFENDGGTKVFPRTGWDGVRYVRLVDPATRTVPERRRA